MTVRKHNFEPAKVIERLNRVIRGTANYFGPDFATNSQRCRLLDEWIRMRLRCMKFKRKSMADNSRLRIRVLRKLGLLSLVDFQQQFVCQRASSDSSINSHESSKTRSSLSNRSDTSP